MAESLTFLSQKMSKVRWKPTASSLQKSESFATGSCEDLKNVVAIWDLSHMTRAHNIDNYEMSDIQNSQPRLVCNCQVNGDVGGMEYAGSDIILVGASSGDVSLLQTDDKGIHTQCSWKGLHSFGGSTDVAANSPELVSVGEDGSIHIMRIETKLPLRTLVKVDSCPITCVQYLNSHDLCTTNTVGQLRIWDIRAPGDSPTRVMVSSEALVALRSVDHHATQSHILATGDNNGCITLFDIRKECAPVTSLQVHEDSVWEVCFHKTSPSHLFTCSEDGCVARLDSSFELKSLSEASAPVDVSEIVSHCGSPINSVDVNGSRMVCCTDAESIYIVEDVV